VRNGVQTWDRSTAAAIPATRKQKYVMFLPWAPTTGGGVNHVVNGLAEASREFYEPVIVVTTWTEPTDHNGPWVYLPGLNPRKPLGFFARLLPTMLRLRAVLKDAAAANPHFGTLECLPLAILRSLRLAPALIVSIHGAEVTEMLATKGLERALCRWLFSHVDLVIGCSEDLTLKFRELCPAARTVAIWNATPPAPEVPAERPIDAQYLLCVAAFVGKKAHEVLISAFAEIHLQFPDLRLVLIGSDGPTRNSITEQINQLGLASHVRILLDRPSREVWWWMRHAACFVLPSREEPFGIVLVEAGKSRTPVVATRVGGVPEYLSDGEDGLLCEPDNPHQLSEAIARTLNDGASTRGRVESFYRKASTFTWTKVFQEYRSAARLP
jgi:glycosyltransferase involved in cell wall biosynthesis